MEWTLGFIGIICLVIGLVDQAFEMRKIRLTTYKDEDLGSANIFMNKRNLLRALLELMYIFPCKHELACDTNK